jgi:hypothetical protein
MKFVIKIAIASLLVTLSTQSWAQNEGVSLQGILATAKYAGACGILDSLVHFQKTTKMDGGDELVSRFWSVEAARLGLTVQQLSDKCNKAICAYGKFWDIAGKADE